MKNFLLLVMVLVFPVAGFSRIADNNFTVNVSGNMLVWLNADSPYIGVGYGYGVDLGNLTLFPSKVLQSLDSKVGFRYSEVTEECGLTIKPLVIYVGSTYTLGKRLRSGYILFDIYGLDIGLLHDRNITGSVAFFYSHTLPLGMKFVSSGGFMIGYRHKINMSSGFGLDTVYDDDDVIGGGNIYSSTDASILSYSLEVGIGFAFGQ